MNAPIIGFKEWTDGLALQAIRADLRAAELGGCMLGKGGIMRVVHRALQAAGWCLCSAALGVSMSGGRAQAQAGAPAAEEAGSSTRAAEQGGIEEVIVFARKKSAGENVQSVPIAISAFSAASLQDAHVEDIAELGRLAPNVQTDTVGTTPGLVNFTIRGVGLNGSIRSIDPAVNVVVDGMTLGYTVGAVVDTFDLQSVEVLRGPQGVLFGRNATGGALVLRTAPPSDTFHASARLTAGSFDRLEGQAVVEGPLLGESILGKVSVSEKYSTGGIENTNQGTFVSSLANPSGAPVDHGTGNIPKTQEIVVKPTFLFRLGDSDRLTLFTQYQNYRDGGTAPINFVPPASVGGPVALQTVYGFSPPGGDYIANTANPGYSRIEAEHAIAQLDNSFGSAGTLTSILAYRFISFDSTIDLLGSPFVLTYLPDNRESNHQVSLESRYNVSLTERLNLLAGIYAYSGTTSVLEDRITSGGAVTPNKLVYIRAQWRQNDETAAVLYQPGIPAARSGDALAWRARYGWEKKQMQIFPSEKLCRDRLSTTARSTSWQVNKHWTDVSPRAALTYQANPDVSAVRELDERLSKRQLQRASYYATGRPDTGRPRISAEHRSRAQVGVFRPHLRLNLTGILRGLQEHPGES